MRKLRAGDGIVYGIADPDTMKTVYIGETIGTMTSRLFQHLASATSLGSKSYDTPFMQWVRSLVLTGRIPIVYQLETVKSIGDGAVDKKSRLEAEAFWMRQLENRGSVLLNSIRSDVNRRVHSKRTVNERREIAMKGVASQTKEQRSEKARKRWASTTGDQRSESARLREQRKGPEVRRPAAIKAWKTKRGNAQ